MLLVHPREVRSTVGTAWILRRSISNLKWVRSNGLGIDDNQPFQELIGSPEHSPLLLFPGENAFNLNQGSLEEWAQLVPQGKRPLFVVIDGTWTEAKVMLQRSHVLKSLPRVSFDVSKESEYGFKRQPHPSCLSSVEGVHRVIELLANRGMGALPSEREHDQMLQIFKRMVRVQLGFNGFRSRQDSCSPGKNSGT